MLNQISGLLLLQAPTIGLQQMRANIDSRMSDILQRMRIGTDTAVSPPAAEAQ